MRKIWGQTSPRKEIRHLIGVAFWPLFQGSSKLICWIHADSSFFNEDIGVAVSRFSENTFIPANREIEFDD